MGAGSTSGRAISRFATRGSARSSLDWEAAGLARPWTDTFDVIGAGIESERSSGPTRWATPNGLRSLVRDLLTGVEVQTGDDGRPAAGWRGGRGHAGRAGRRLLPVPDAVENDPTIAVVCGFDARDWTFTDAAFVKDHPVLTFIADDGARRGDGAAVLVAHSTPEFARRIFRRCDSAVGPVASALGELLGVAAPAVDPRPSLGTGQAIGRARFDVRAGGR